METVSLLQAPVRSRKDVVRVLHQARQLARLLRFSAAEQTEIGCESFALALQALTKKSGAVVFFELAKETLLVQVRPAGRKNLAAPPEPAGFIKRLPAPVELSREDFVWVLGQLQLLLKVDVLEVMKQQNDDLLEMLRALRCCRNDLDQLRHSATEPSAA